MILCVQICVLGAVAGMGIQRVGAIVSKIQEKGSPRKSGSRLVRDHDSQDSASHFVEREYLNGYDENYEHGGLGLSAHSIGYNHEGFDGHHHEEQHLHHHHLHHVHKYHDDTAYHKALAIKGLLAPLAGVALLGAAAAFVSNPILLQLGVISGTPWGRRRRDTSASSMNRLTLKDETRLEDIKTLERFMAQIPKKDIQVQEKKMVATLLSCSGFFNENSCLHRLACELYSAEAVSMPTEANVLTIVLNEIFNNDYVDSNLKNQISKAIQWGRRNSGCELYKCQALEGYQTRGKTPFKRKNTKM